MELEKLKYPIGKYRPNKTPDQDTLNQWIDDLTELPNRVMSLTKGLSPEALQFHYRPEGWTIQQVVHHLADSHMNSIIRFKLALTEDSPTIRPYFEDRWAKLADVATVDISASLNILTGVHLRLTTLLRSLTDNELNRDFIHPEHNKHMTILETIGMYAWHSNHHCAHIEQALKFKNNF